MMGKRKYNLKHKIWAEAIKWKFGGKCAICGATSYINAHHLIPWEVEKYRFDYNNGIALCPTHHTKYSYGISPHSDGSILFAIFLLKHYPEILKWVEENFNEDCFG